MDAHENRPAAGSGLFPCGSCGSLLEAAAAPRGGSGRCPACGALVDVPPLDPRTGLRTSSAASHLELNDGAAIHAYAAAGERAPEIIKTQENAYCIVCPRCARRCDIEAQACGHCGQPFTIAGAAATSDRRADRLEVAALLVALLGLGLVLCAPLVGAVLTLLALALAAWALWRPGPAPTAGGRRLIRAALILASLGLGACLLRTFGP